MITLLKGGATRVRDHEAVMIKQWKTTHPKGEVIRRDSDELSLDELIQILQADDLFATTRLLALRMTADVSHAKLWADGFATTTLDCIISSGDTKLSPAFTTALKQIGAVTIDLGKPLSAHARREHVEKYVDQHHIPLEPAALTTLLEQSSLSGQALERELDKLALLGRPITKDDCLYYVTSSSQASIFTVFDLAASGRAQAAMEQLSQLKYGENAHQCFAVLSGTIASLASVAAGESAGIHPFVATKLKQTIKRRGEAWVEHVLEAGMKTEHMMKRARADEWQMLEWLITQIA